MANKKRKCAHCKKYGLVEEMIKPNNLNAFCNIDCAAQYGQKKARLTIKKRERKELKEAKERLKTNRELCNELQSLVNKAARLRDHYKGCISCDKNRHWQGQWHAGHYYSRGHSASIRFNLNNIHKQCSICNNHLSGNIQGYTPRLIEKIGQENYQFLVENKSKPRRYSREYIEKAKRVFKRLVKRYQKRLKM